MLTRTMSSNTSSLSSEPGQLNVIALISGGKDSLYSILHCLRNGHRVVALANLYPHLSSPLPSQNRKRVISSDSNQGDYRREKQHLQECAVVGKEHNSGDDDSEEDLNSFMYQTVGHRVIPLYEAALGIPLYRAPIKGRARDTSRIYRDQALGPRFVGLDRVLREGGVQEMEEEGEEADDETESLVPLLEHIKKEHPSANAVSAGAILSTYQRTRIEDVAGRLGLVPLAWLWMYPMLPSPVERNAVNPVVSSGVPNAGLLEDMAACGCETRIIKVASGGLDSDFLWGDVTSQDGEVRRKTVKAMRRFACKDLESAVLGEGGEYETLALDGPGFLWKNRIVVEADAREVKDVGGGVSYVRIKEARCVPKLTPLTKIETQSIRKPSMLDARFARIFEEILTRGPIEHFAGNWMPDVNYRPPHWAVQMTRSESVQFWTISNITAPDAGNMASEQMKGIGKKLEEVLDIIPHTEHGKRTTDDIIFATVLLRRMQDFPSVNGVYVSLFKKPNPPARVTVGCGDTLPQNIGIMASFIVDLGPRNMRQGLHVQSRSYWAPANIGPYSQAIAISFCGDGEVSDGKSGMVYIAGQIPLEPASMDIAWLATVAADKRWWFNNYVLHATLSLQHLWRIGTAMQVDWWLGAVAFLSGEEQIQTKAQVAWDLWEKMNTKRIEADEEDDESTVDIWDVKYGHRGVLGTARPQERTLPNFEVAAEEPQIPPFLVAQVDELPRGSDIEWQGLGSRCRQVKSVGKSVSGYLMVQTTIINEGDSLSSIEIDVECGFAFEMCIKQAMGFQRPGNGASQAVIYTAYPVPKDLWGGQIIPCKSIWGSKARRLAAVVIL